MENEEREVNYDPGALDAFMGGDNKIKDVRKTLKRLGKYIFQFKLRFSLVILFTILTGVFTLATPTLIGDVITEVFTNLMISFETSVPFTMNTETIVNIIIILSILYISSLIFSWIAQIFMGRIAHSMGKQLRDEIAHKLNRLPLSFYDKNKRGDILSKATNDVDAVANGFSDFFIGIINAAITVVGALVMMIWIDFILTLVAIAVMPFVMGVVMFISGKMKKLSDRSQKKLGETNGHIEESYTGILAIKAYTNEQKTMDEFEKLNKELYEIDLKSSVVSGLLTPIAMIVNSLGYVIMAAVGASFVISGRLQIGSVIAFIRYANFFGEPMAQGGYMWTMLQTALASAERIFDFLDEVEEVRTFKEAKLNAVKGQISFENIKFGYSEENVLIENISLNLNAGEKVAIVGPTGAGKTTLVNLIMRFYELLDGKIKLDNVDIKDMPRKELRTHFGMVLQDTWIFDGTIFENIAYGKENATKEEVIAAATAARIDYFIRTLPEGYDTVLGDGIGISSGQMQLLTIARVFLKNPEVIILDEATSNIDTATELEIQKSMTNLMRGRTSFVIAHRLSTIKDANTILVMDKGSIIEIGSHEKLLSDNGFYASLYNSQFESA